MSKFQLDTMPTHFLIVYKNQDFANDSSQLNFQSESQVNQAAIEA